MSTACQSQGWASRLAINGQEMEFLSARGGQRIDLIDTSSEAIRGDLDHYEDRVIHGLKRVRIEIRMNPTPTEYTVLLPLMGFTDTGGGVWEPVDNFEAVNYTPFEVILDHVAKVHSYSGCVIDTAILRGQMGRSPISLDLAIIGVEESETDAGTFAATPISPDLNYAFHDSSISLEDAERAMDRFAFAIQNKLFASFNNSQVTECIYPTDRNFTLGLSSPYNPSHTDLYTKGVASPAGNSAWLSFARAGRSTRYDFHNLKLIPETPDILGKEEIRLDQFYRAYRSTANPVVKITHDATP